MKFNNGCRKTFICIKNKPYRRADYTGINCDINMWVAKFLPLERYELKLKQEDGQCNLLLNDACSC